MVKNKKIASIDLQGGSICLDFVNSVHDRTEQPIRDYLLQPDDLLAWGAKSNLLDTKTEKLLEAWMKSYPGKADQSFKDALLFRGLIYSMFYSISKGKKISANDLEAYNKYLAMYFPSLRLKAHQGSYKEDWDLPMEGFSWIVAPVINDAYELLLSDKLDRIKECPNCGWLFLDTTKNGKRRWCSMKSCGSTVKALDYYYRKKEKA